MAFDGTSLFLINVNYGIMAVLILLSVLNYLIYTKWKFGKGVGFALLSFVIALTFRVADRWEWLRESLNGRIIDIKY